MLMAVVFVFFICNILALVVNILEVIEIQIIALNNISNLLVSDQLKLFCISSFLWLFFMVKEKIIFYLQKQDLVFQFA